MNLQRLMAKRGAGARQALPDVRGARRGICGCLMMHVEWRACRVILGGRDDQPNWGLGTGRSNVCTREDVICGCEVTAMMEGREAYARRPCVER